MSLPRVRDSTGQETNGTNEDREVAENRFIPLQIEAGGKKK